VPAPVSVLIITQIRLYADGIATALDELDVIDRVAVEPCCDTALKRLARDPTDVVVLDLAGIDDVAAAPAFVRAAPPAHVVALTVREHDQDIVAWAEHGAMGIVTRQASFDDLLHAILAAARGECGCSPRVAAALLRRVAVVAAERRNVTPYVALTLREREIVDLLVEGLSNKEIATRLLLGVSTVKNHVHNVLRKVGAGTRSEAVALLLEMKIQARPPGGTGSQTRLSA
jgi:two-component system nitrate/nitrite response regulator NarL